MNRIVRRRRAQICAFFCDISTSSPSKAVLLRHVTLRYESLISDLHGCTRVSTVVQCKWVAVIEQGQGEVRAIEAAASICYLLLVLVT